MSVRGGFTLDSRSQASARPANAGVAGVAHRQAQDPREGYVSNGHGPRFGTVEDLEVLQADRAPAQLTVSPNGHAAPTIGGALRRYRGISVGLAASHAVGVVPAL